MKKERFTTRAHKTTRYYSSSNGAKLTHVKARAKDTSDWWYVWDITGAYKGCVNNIKGRDTLREITKEEFLKS